jgi:hypothetical protein
MKKALGVTQYICAQRTYRPLARIEGEGESLNNSKNWQLLYVQILTITATRRKRRLLLTSLPRNLLTLWRQCPRNRAMLRYLTPFFSSIFLINSILDEGEE